MTGQLINVLDHGFVRLVDSMGSDLSVVRAARVSYDAAWRAGQDEGSDERLINYLWRNQHTSPLEAVEFQFEVKAPIFVLRQWHRHRTWTYNELSARYRPLPEEFYIPDAAMVGEQDSVNRQGRVVAGEAHPEDIGTYVTACSHAFHSYHQLLKAGWPRELARAVLPVATYSHMFAKVNLRNLFHFLSLRTDPHAQYEIRCYAEAIISLIEPIVPVCLAAWRKAA